MNFLNFLFCPEKKSTFRQETSSLQRSWCHNAKVRATRAVPLPDLLERTMLTILCSIKCRLAQKEHSVHCGVQFYMLRRFTRMFVRMHPSVSNASPSRLRMIDDVEFYTPPRASTHITPTNNASILPTHVHENVSLSRDRLCNSLFNTKPHERNHTHGSQKVLQSCSDLEKRNQAHDTWFL